MNSLPNAIASASPDHFGPTERESPFRRNQRLLEEGSGFRPKRTAKRPPPPKGKKTAKPSPSQRELLLPITATGHAKKATTEQPKKPAVRKPAVRKKAG